VNSNLRTRIFTAVPLAVGLFAVVLLLPASATVGLLTVLILLGAWEWSAFLQLSRWLPRAVYVVAIALLLLGLSQLIQTPGEHQILMSAAVVWWLLALVWIFCAPAHVAPWSAALAGILVLVPAWFALVRLRLDMPRGAEWLLFVFILVWMADIGGYFFGRHYGRVRLAPKVSPGKTWEGALGGLLLSLLVAVAALLWFEVAPAAFLALCLAVVAFSIVGDLTESLLKRSAGLKDSGTIFPGHGGVMDRIDSVTAAAPVLYFGLTTLGVAG
jgi:phosphatidate cytidylyltransferase